MPQAPFLTASALRRELSLRALRHARLHPHESTYSSTPSILFQEHQGLHGNFHPDSYRAILANPAWSARLTKSYTASSRVPRRHDRSRCELDCANSSDALLMNIFCYPGILAAWPLRALLGLAAHAELDRDQQIAPCFGYKPRIPLNTSRRKRSVSTVPIRPLFDRTEIDMLLGPLLIEAKLTETGFQRAPLASVQRYPAFEELFNAEELPMTGSSVDSYQLIRGVLAAHHENRSFAVLCDARRADLIERWFQVLRAVRPCELRSRLALLTWQEIAAVLPAPLRLFLSEKYGISAV